MARLIEQYEQHCRCKHGCRTSATIKKWDCGCVEVFLHNEQAAGCDCTDFRGMRRSCGRDGKPRQS